MIQLYSQDEKGQIQQVPDYGGQTVEWIHLLEPEEEEIHELIRRFRLPMDFLTSAFDPDELARYEKFKRKDGREVTLIVLNYPKGVEGETHQYVTRPLVIVLLEGLLITAAEEMPAFLDSLMMRTGKEQVTLEDTFQVALRIVMDIAVQYINCLEHINASTEKIEKQIIQSTKTEYLINMMYLKKSLVYIRTAIDTNHPVILELENRSEMKENYRRRALLHDVHIETIQAEKMAEQTLLLLDHISDMFSSIINNNVNRVMKLLTSLTLLLTIPSLIGALWGMNVPVPFENSGMGFWMINGSIVLISLVTYVWLRKNDFF